MTCQRPPSPVCGLRLSAGGGQSEHEQQRLRGHAEVGQLSDVVQRVDVLLELVLQEPGAAHTAREAG